MIARSYQSTIPGSQQVLGAYRTSHRCALVATQAAGSRLFEVRNAGARVLHVPLQLRIKVAQTAAFTAAIENSVDVFRNTAFTAVDSANVITPGASVAFTSMAAAPGNALVRGVTVAGAAAGMTGGTRTPDGAPLGQAPYLASASFADPVHLDFLVFDFFATDVKLDFPFVFALNEGFEVQNRVLLGAAAGASVYIDYMWAEYQG